MTRIISVHVRLTLHLDYLLHIAMLLLTVLVVYLIDGTVVMFLSLLKSAKLKLVDYLYLNL